MTSTGSIALGAERERGDRLHAADRVDLVGARTVGGGEDGGSTPPSGPGGVATATRSTPADLAGTQHISAEDG